MSGLFLIADFVVAGVLIWLVNALALRGFRRARGEHWTERARQLYPARVGALTNLWTVPVAVVLAQQFFWPELVPHWLLGGLCAAMGAVAGTWFYDREVLPQLTFREWLHDAVAGTTLRLFTILVFMGAAALMPAELDWRVWALAGGVTLVQSVWAIKGVVRAFEMLRLAVPATDELRGLVERVAGQMNVRVKRVLILKTRLMQAYALPYTGELLFSERLLKACTEKEIEAVAAHEIGHLSESKPVRLARLFRVLALVPWVFMKPAHHAFGPGGIAAIGVLPIILLIPLNRLSRKWEARADKMAAEQEGGGAALATALRKLHEGNLMPAVMPTRRTTHPDLYDRMQAAGVEPGFPRPKPPVKIAWTATLMSGAMGLFLAFTFIRGAERNATEGMYDEEQPAARPGEFMSREVDEIVAKITATKATGTNSSRGTNASGLEYNR